ncbi:hypothetical protein N7G274_000202 [Stereocaulon virgatum]|uniref:AAA+ ATPase domain-containing protein n=1 Tax=Stereocaulon virgatum TaxID=373712 RepID=A0ABR4AU06_9LECA
MAVVISMGKDHGAAVHPFFLQKNTKPSVETDFDQNDGRRKRQRTASPEQAQGTPSGVATAAWVDQLQAAASERLADINDADKFTSPQCEYVGQSQLNASVDETKGRGRGGSASEFSPLVVGDGTAEKQNGQPSITLLSQRTAVTPPKRMLRVRPDGKLGSPKAIDFVQDIKPKRGRRATKAGAAPTKLVVTVKYGIDDGSRTSIGQKIDNICSGVAIMAGSSGERQKKSIEPPKPTHPFFLGAPAVVPSQHSKTPDNDQWRHDLDAVPTAQKRKNVCPREARVNSRPADIADNPVGGVTFGCNAFGSDHARISRFPGAVEPIWPPADMIHIGRPQSSLARPTGPTQARGATNTVRKMKSAQIRVQEDEDVLKPYDDLVRMCRLDKGVSQTFQSWDWREFRRPLRRLMTGRELQQAVLPRLDSGSALNLADDADMDELSSSRPFQSAALPMLQHLYDHIASSLTAFDKFECETQDWTHKYAPKTAEHVLQQSHDVILLRNWLKGLTITSVECREHENPRTRDSSVASGGRGATKRKRKRAEELDGFVVSSDEEASLMDEVTNLEDFQPSNFLLKKSVIRSGLATGNLGNNDRSSNAVVISGPHGCGKTAAIYAVAQELGFEVFEINAASRRSGRDILDKVGDMTRNHLVRKDPDDQATVAKDDSEEQQLVNEKLKRDLESGRQGTMNSFFKSTGGPKEKPLSKKRSSPRKGMPKSNEQPKKPKSQKQSLILLEEVDVLFEEDKMFWTTVLDMLAQSKRPVIMTCSDESLLPLHDMALYAIFRFRPPTEQLATDYLLLVACNEGHLLPRDAVSMLYKAKGSDLRGSLADLNFFCQMAIGDTKGGLEWMLIRSSADGLQDRNSESIRVVSESTYQRGMGWLSGESNPLQPEHFLVQETELLSEAWEGWDIDIGASEDFLAVHAPACLEETLPRQAVEALCNFEQACEALSAADVFPSRVSRGFDTVLLNTATPELTENMRHNYVEGSNVLQADPVIDQTGLSDSLALTLKTCARRISRRNGSNDDPSPPINQMILDIIPMTVQETLLHNRMTKVTISPAFDPIARSQKPVLGISKGPQISVFDGPISIIAEDLAPYARSIVSYDLRLEEQRRQLSSLLSHPLNDGKKARTTRASRAALEGGDKANTRRERWFPNNTDFRAILQSGGRDWQDVLLRRIDAERIDDDRSHGSEDGSAVESDA